MGENGGYFGDGAVRRGIETFLSGPDGKREGGSAGGGKDGEPVDTADLGGGSPLALCVEDMAGKLPEGHQGGEESGNVTAEASEGDPGVFDGSGGAEGSGGGFETEEKLGIGGAEIGDDLGEDVASEFGGVR